MKSGNLNFLEPSGPLQACNGTALPLPIIIIIIIVIIIGARGGVVVKALRYKPAGRGFDSRRCH
jgi:hypothetical protein